MRVAPASREFSSSSLSADEGRWITSPAAMRLTTSCERHKMAAGAGALELAGAGRGVDNNTEIATPDDDDDRR